MLKRLHKKFIFINMSLVTLVLLIVFSVLLLTNYQRLQNESRTLLHKALSRNMQALPPKLEIGNGKRPPDERPFPILPTICVLLDENNGIVSVVKDNIEVSEDVLDNAIADVLLTGKKEGVLSGLSLRFLMENTQNGTKIAFVDIRNEISSMGNLILSSLLVGALALLAFFLISLFLSSWALRPVERAWGQQRQFVADASHELKTPLTVILANLSILLSHRQDKIEDRAKWLENTQEEALQMKGLVEDLLFLAKSDSAQLPLIRGQFSLSDAAWECLLAFESVAFERKISLDSSIPDQICMIGNESQIKQIISILLDNACKYTEENGSVYLRLESLQDRVKIQVSNTGRLISKEQLAHLFERFYRADFSRSKEQGSYGLGLAIAKSITDKHKGKIFAESELKKGNTFTVILPVR